MAMRRWPANGWSPAWDPDGEPRSGWATSCRIKLDLDLEAALDLEKKLDAGLAGDGVRGRLLAARSTFDIWTARTREHADLWAEARQLLEQSAPALQVRLLHRNAWRALAVLAEQREDDASAVEAYKRSGAAYRRILSDRIAIFSRLKVAVVQTVPACAAINTG